MNSIRYHIINNFYQNDFNTLKRAIEESVTERNELNLPGLGVFFEILWEHSTQEMKNEIIDLLRKEIKKELDNL